jgi:hypothetical protein
MERKLQIGGHWGLGVGAQDGENSVVPRVLAAV